jgi:hypothetical protein
MPTQRPCPAPQAPQRQTRTTKTSPPPSACPGYVSASKVVKKLRPGRPGTQGAWRDYQDALVCVRYRRDPLGLSRIKTVEITIDSGPIAPRRFDAASFGIELARGEVELRARLKATGARWDPHGRLWWAKGRVIRELGLEDRIREC